jgi:uncharacterized protein (DUF2267 family)
VWWRKRGRDVLRPHELVVLDAVRERLAPEAASLLVQQLDQIEMAQRFGDDREVNLYPNRRGPQRHDPAVQFPNREAELRLATVRLVGPLGRGRADVFVVLGHVFSLGFKPRPRDLGDLRAIAVQGDGVTIHADPMVPTPGAADEQRLGELDPALLAELQAMWADGSAERLGVGGPSELYRIGLDDGEHIVLWQDDATFLVARIEPAVAGVLRVSPDDGLIREYPDLRTALADPEPID